MNAEMVLIRREGLAPQVSFSCKVALCIVDVPDLIWLTHAVSPEIDPEHGLLQLFNRAHIRQDGQTLFLGLGKKRLLLLIAHGKTKAQTTVTIYIFQAKPLSYGGTFFFCKPGELGHAKYHFKTSAAFLTKT